MSLRTALLAIGAIAALAGAALLLAGTWEGGVQLLVAGLVILLGTALERWRYRVHSPADARWERTGERFEDPVTGEPMEVLYDRTSGERRYVRTDRGEPPA